MFWWHQRFDSGDNPKYAAFKEAFVVPRLQAPR